MFLFSPRSEEGKFQQLLEVSSELKRRLRNFCQKTIAVKVTLKKLQGTEKGARRVR